MTKTLYLIDGSGFIFRAYHSLPPLTNPEGTPVGAVYGFVNMILRLMDGRTAESVAVIFDAARLTFRNRLYPEYKAHRPPAPDDLIPQFALVREATVAMGLPAIELPDFEADDLIATYADLAAKQGMEVVIVSSDKDLMQCIRAGISMYDPMKQKSIGAPEVMEKFGVTPDKVIDVLALIGDSSDNVPGVPSIGPKTAAELIQTYGSLDALLERAAEIKQPKRREAIENNADKARLSRELVTLCHDVPIPVPLAELVLKQPDPARLQEFLMRQGFKSLQGKLREKFGFQPEETNTSTPPPSRALPTSTTPSTINHQPTAVHYELVRDEATLNRWIAQSFEAGFVAFDLETTSLDAMQAQIVGFSLCIEPGKACYVPVGHVTEGGDAPKQPSLFDTPAPTRQRVEGQIAPERALALLKPLLASPAVLKIGQNIKYDMLVLAQHHVTITPVDDSMLLSYILHAGRHTHGMDELAQRYLHHKTLTYNEVTGSGRARISFAKVPLDKACNYAAEDADITLRLHRLFKPQVAEQKLLTLYETTERALIPVLVEMERCGIKVDRTELTRLSNYFESEMNSLSQQIFNLAGHEFNIGSPKQLGEVLFDEMQLASGRKSAKTGAYSTDSDVLEELAEQGQTIATHVLSWRQLAKLKGTYTDALAAQINPSTGRVHTSFAMAITSTGRLSSSDPNLQNIPIRSEEGKKIRRAFIAETGCKLISADYSQIELRLLAHVADITPLKEAFRNGDDIHAITASEMFGVPVHEVDPDLRRKAKTINFGIIYGISAHGLAARLGIGRSEAADYIARYFGQYPGIRDYMENCKETARRLGYVTTLFGRRCHVPGIHDKNAGTRQFSERAAINAPLQGTAADIIKRAMVAVERALSGQTSRLLLQVHDELVLEAPKADAAATATLVRKHMEQAVSLSVPLTVECGIGDNWGEIH